MVLLVKHLEEVEAYKNYEEGVSNAIRVTINRNGTTAEKVSHGQQMVTRSIAGASSWDFF